MGMIWSSPPWVVRVGTAILRSFVKLVSENG